MTEYVYFKHVLTYFKQFIIVYLKPDFFLIFLCYEAPVYQKTIKNNQNGKPHCYTHAVVCCFKYSLEHEIDHTELFYEIYFSDQFVGLELYSIGKQQQWWHFNWHQQNNLKVTDT